MFYSGGLTESIVAFDHSEFKLEKASMAAASLESAGGCAGSAKVVAFHGFENCC